jgi:hypothetical protein
LPQETDSVTQNTGLNQTNMSDSNVKESSLTTWIIMVTMYGEDRHGNIEVWVLIIDNWMSAVSEVPCLVTQKFHCHGSSKQTGQQIYFKLLDKGEAQLLRLFVWTLSSVLILST